MWQQKEGQEYLNALWEDSIIPSVSEYIEIENQSPSFDANWRENGLLIKAAEHLMKWIKTTTTEIPDFVCELIQLEERTPVIFMTLPASGSLNEKDTVLMYGHLDKQPPLTEAWESGLHPYKPVIRDGKLYGRGGADDGYSTYAAVAAVLALRKQKVPHGRIVILIEACEESGSQDLPFYVSQLESRIGVPSLIVCLDSGCGNYDSLWLTTSLRGLVTGNLRVSILTEASHSGHASGVVPSSFRILRQLLSRIEDESTGQILIKDLYVDVPADRLAQNDACAQTLGDDIFEEFAFVEGAGPISKDIPQLLLNRCWKPQLSVTGQEGMPPLSNAGNVLRTSTAVKLSMRLPPTKNPKEGIASLKKVLEEAPPYGAQVVFEPEKCSPGWNSPALAHWLEQSVHKASQSFYSQPANFIGEGGSIPFMGMLGAKFPEAQFMIIGVLGPKSNAHGPNEFLHLSYAKKLNACVASVLADHKSHFN
eukprot:TRINITY_DN2270_c0_g1_i1.p1 TRINITY_DN2270_c0_g1~~TRINITY_DN2270_c0_g1_i1.p1  ORF type:complete len:479 (-),score=98.52 TRINITY_DN2270_c0_g1_i1:48-1484(-)